MRDARTLGRQGTQEASRNPIDDINDPGDEYDGEFRKLSVDDMDGVVAAAEGMDAIINLSVLRPHRQIAFDVNTRGNFNMMLAAKTHDIKRVINTGPHFQLVRRAVRGLGLRAKPRHAARIRNTPLRTLKRTRPGDMPRLQRHLRHLRHHDALLQHATHLELGDRTRRRARDAAHDMTPFTTAWTDCGTAILAALEVPLSKLPSRCETFFTFPETPHHKFNSEKTRRILGWQPRYTLETLWNKPPMQPPSHQHGGW